MKCAACGYEDDQMFFTQLELVREVNLHQSDYEAMYEPEVKYTYLYACPECHTVRFE